MTDYEKQANDFLTTTGATLEVAHKETGQYFNDEKFVRDIWNVKLSRGTRTYQFTFGTSVYNREIWDKEPYTIAGGGLRSMPQPHTTYLSIEKLNESKRKKEKDFAPAGTGHRPSAYTILSCLNGYEPENTVDDFAENFGYTKPSEAIAAFQRVQDEWHNLQKLFTDAEIEILNEIN